MKKISLVMVISLCLLAAKPARADYIPMGKVVSQAVVGCAALGAGAALVLYIVSESTKGTWKLGGVACAVGAMIVGGSVSASYAHEISEDQLDEILDSGQVTVVDGTENSAASPQ